jgi:hypothetical protein
LAEIDWCYQAARAGHLEVLQWLCAEGQCRLWSRASKVAATLGHLRVLEWMVDTAGLPAESMAAPAARAGQLHVLQWLVPRQAQPNPGMFVRCQAVCGGQVHVLQWALAEGWICQDRHGATYLFETAVCAGQVNVLDWIRTVCPAVTPGNRTWCNACETEQLVSMAWIRCQFPARHAPRWVWRRARDRELCGGQMIQWLRDNFEHHPI